MLIDQPDCLLTCRAKRAAVLDALVSALTIASAIIMLEGCEMPSDRDTAYIETVVSMRSAGESPSLNIESEDLDDQGSLDQSSAEQVDQLSGEQMDQSSGERGDMSDEVPTDMSNLSDMSAPVDMMIEEDMSLITDSDNDGIVDAFDNCRLQFNPGQRDNDGDGVGDLCDNCAQVPNSDQADRDRDLRGDMCDESFDQIVVIMEPEQEADEIRLLISDPFTKRFQGSDCDYQSPTSACNVERRGELQIARINNPLAGKHLLAITFEDLRRGSITVQISCHDISSTAHREALIKRRLIIPSRIRNGVWDVLRLSLPSCDLEYLDRFYDFDDCRTSLCFEQCTRSMCDPDRCAEREFCNPYTGSCSAMCDESDCEDGLICSEGEACVTCVSDEQCDSGQICWGSECVTIAGADRDMAPWNQGAPEECSFNGSQPCPADEVCADRSCLLPCSPALLCPEGAQCCDDRCVPEANIEGATCP